MKTLKLVFHEKTTKERNDGSPVSMEFKGNWDNNSNMPEITLRLTKCNEESAGDILEDLGLETPGEFIFLTQGVNPQIRLDQFFAKAEKRRTSQIGNFKVEIEALDDEMISERYDKITDALDAMIKAGEAESKRFGFYFDCFGVIYEKRVGYASDVTKEEYIKNHTYAEAVNNFEELDDRVSTDTDLYEDDTDSFEEE